MKEIQLRPKISLGFQKIVFAFPHQSHKKCAVHDNSDNNNDDSDDDDDDDDDDDANDDDDDENFSLLCV